MRMAIEFFLIAAGVALFIIDALTMKKQTTDSAFGVFVMGALCIGAGIIMHLNP